MWIYYKKIMNEKCFETKCTRNNNYVKGQRSYYKIISGFTPIHKNAIIQWIKEDIVTQ